MKAVSYQAWWLLAMMKGGGGMFSRPSTVVRKTWKTIQRTTAKTAR